MILTTTCAALAAVAVHRFGRHSFQFSVLSMAAHQVERDHAQPCTVCKAMERVRSRHGWIAAAYFAAVPVLVFCAALAGARGLP